MMKVIIASQKECTTLTAQWIQLETTTGTVVIQKNHAPTLMRIKPESTVIIERESGIQEFLKQSSGVVHVELEQVTIILY